MQPASPSDGALLATDLSVPADFVRRLNLSVKNHVLGSQGSNLGPAYISALLELNLLSTETTLEVIALLKDSDPNFLFKFARSAAALTAPALILRALSLVPMLGDYEILIYWLRNLTQHSDLHVRSRSVKLLCHLRPNKGMVERQMESTDARTRASAIEALWYTSADSSRTFFQKALTDHHHRVVSNALVGLHFQGVPEAFDKMMMLCSHKQHLFRAAAAWAMGMVKDPRFLPILRELTSDRSFTVRKRATDSIKLIEEDLQAQSDLQHQTSLKLRAPVPPDDTEPVYIPKLEWLR